MIFVFMMRLTASIFIYLLLIASILSLLGLGAYLIVSPTNEYSAFLNTVFRNNYISIAVGAACLILGLVILIVACCFRNRI